MTRASGIGSLPGEDAHEAARVVLGELPDLPHLPELPARGALADLTGRAVAVVSDLGFDLQPAGWRLTDAAGVDHRRARSLLAQDLDAFEEESQGFTGTLKVQVAGPWTLAATVEKPRGDKVLSDHGARRDLAQALAEGVRTHLADVARRVPGAELVLQVDEPALPAVLAARVPTASGFGRHRSVTPPVASEALEWVLDAADDRLTVVHCCDAEVPVGLLRSAGAGAVSVDVATLAVTAYDELATVLDEGGTALLGVLPATGSAAPSVKAAVERTMRLLDMLGLDPAEVSDRLVLTPACGLAGATPAYARAVLAALRGAAEALT
ncbi:methionine synthase [Nocardioides aurantiacus]|uniref:Cobalamin-independent methionine synthase catalytic subunit n=1 Tax=Nocardioides aurantiacus TaxID=86796 RepID=A0A3N2CQX9_9ACTN|nr:methionine synthase [Nocardioides aurantiacus]ROR89932.1 cobalamin-independent methionine synthase catalytic subunit [Nocardioides aurantiacus]